MSYSCQTGIEIIMPLARFPKIIRHVFQRKTKKLEQACEVHILEYLVFGF